MAKTISELRNQSIQVRDASAAGENTATRVGTVLNDIVGHIEDYENTQSSNNSSQDAKIEGVKSSLDAEIARAKTEESNLRTQIGTERTERQAAVSKEETARIQADNDEKTAREQADNAEQDARIKADNDEKTARENADITLRTMIQTEVRDREKAVAAEAARAKAAEQANAQAIADETARAMAAEEAETTRAAAEEQRLQGEIDNMDDNLNSLDNKVNSNHDHLTDEVARLDLTDNEIKADLETEIARAKAAEEVNGQAITDEVARAKAAEEVNGQAINTLEYKTSEITKGVNKTEEDSISIEDNNGNEVFHLDENGLDAKNVKSNGKDVLTEHQDISGLATKKDVEEIVKNIEQEEVTDKEEETVFASDDYDKDNAGEKYVSIGKYGVKSKGYFDLNGNSIIGKDSWLKGKTIFTIGDSLCALGQWQTKLVELSGAIFDEDVNNHPTYPVSRGGTYTFSESGLHAMARAKFLVEHWVRQEGKQVDVLFVECYNDISKAYGYIHSTESINDEAFFENQRIILDTTFNSQQEFIDYVKANLATIAHTPMSGTVIYGKYYTGAPAKRITISSLPTNNGNFDIVTHLERKTIAVLANDSVAEIARKIEEVAYEGYTDTLNADNTVDFVSSSDDCSIIIENNTCGAVISVGDKPNAYAQTMMLYKLKDTSDFYNTANWLDNKESQAYFFASLYKCYKGLLSYLIKNLPNTKIYWLCPCVLNVNLTNPPANYTYADGSWDYSKYFKEPEAWTGSQNDGNTGGQFRALCKIQKEVANLMGIGVIDINDCGINLDNGKYYFNNNNVHPKQEGYEYWAKSIYNKIK